ncbi:hypothetical protein D1BOALGB6SA_3044 [Olavius sp. associated proteobacterium Delta 1]|nr:hypothetical protein D1BOALGB6SA_3044 [Olavius sp. associated proteobacterium Delta 1]
MKSEVHLIAGAVATLTIASFFTSTILVELFGSKEAIAMVKSLIVMPGLLILIPAIAATGGTGFTLSKSRKGRLVENKKKRIPIIGANGVFILVPAAILLNGWASAGSFDTKFYVVQIIEIIAGATNLAMMGLNIRDGLKLCGRLRPLKILRPTQKLPG